MTNNTNNQEWWEKEFDQYDLMYEADIIGGDAIIAKRNHRVDKQGYCDRRDIWSMEDVKAFIRKVSQQSREDALKERTEGILKRLQELSSHGVEVSYISNGETKSYVTGLGNLHIKDVEKMFERDFKLPPKQ